MIIRSCLTVVGAFLVVSFTPSPARATGPSVDLLSQQWPARWIAPAAVAPEAYGVYHFRRSFALPAKPEHFVVHVSADNRYRLFVNGKSLGFGPQRSDAFHWRYETYDLAPELVAGANVVAVEVANFGVERPYALMGRTTGLLVQGDSAAEKVLNSGADWRVLNSSSFAPVPPDRARLKTYIVCGPGDRIDGSKYPWGWQTAAFDDSAWTPPQVNGPGVPSGVGTDVDRWLEPRNLPAMEETPVRFTSVRRVSGVSVPAGFPAAAAPLVVPANTEAVVLLDQGFETNAFPQLVVSGGAGASVTLSYAEALFDAKGAKGNRNEIEGRELLGVSDAFFPDGGTRRHFSTTDFRCYRYAELRVKTGAQPLTVEDLYGHHTGYPFAENASFKSDGPGLEKIWEVGWRTARACAFETYMDCPYYERLQYVGDTRIQALVSLYVSGDDRLMRNAINLYDQSRIADGLTQSRYPSSTPQIINTFSLFWVDMVFDYWMHKPDQAFAVSHLNGVESVLRWFEEHLDSGTGVLGKLPYWTFVDWTAEWPWDQALGSGGEAPGAHTGGSTLVTLQYIMTLDHASQLLKAGGRIERSDHYRRLADTLRRNVRNRAWDAQRQLYTDVVGGTTFSQHTNALAILAKVHPSQDNAALIERTLKEKDLVQCSLYFRFYLLRAMKEAGLGDRYLSELKPWQEMVALGLTTFAEKQDPTRSDCHAWSASPVYELLATVCGIEPASPGFATVRVEPHLGALTWAEASVPHPKGKIDARFDTRTGNHATLKLPEGVTGTLRWKGRDFPLKSGDNQITF